MKRIWILSAMVAVACAGCGEAPSHAAPPVARTHTVAGRGVTVALPHGWTRARESLTPGLTDPREVISVGTYPLRYREGGCSHMPTSALTDIGPRDALVTVQERGHGSSAEWAGFPPRPAHFGPEPSDGRSDAFGCVPGARFTDHWFTFADGGRRFHVLVAFGQQAPTRVQQEAWTILDQMRIDPAVQPNWNSTP